MPILEMISIVALAAGAVLCFLPTRRRGLALLLLGAGLIAALAAALAGGWQAWPGILASLLLPAPLLMRRSRWQRIAGWAIGALGVIALAACVLALYLFPVFSLPRPDGSHAVGTRQFEMTDSSRTGVLEDAAGTPRRFLVRAWYPAVVAEGAEPGSYFSDRETELARSVASNWGLPAFVFDHFRRVPTHAFTDAPLQQPAQRHPVVVFNHGYWGWAGQNSALMEKLASHGFIVFSIAHSHDAGTLTFADGTRIPTSPNKAAASVPTEGMFAFWKARTHEAHYAALKQYQLDFDRHRVMRSFAAWRADIRFLVDALEARRLPAAPELAAAADLSRLAYVGMSFGGTSSSSACHHDTRCRAAVNLDGEEFDWSLYDTDVRMPLLVVHADFERYPAFGPGNGTPGSSINDYAYERWSEAGQNATVHRARIRDQRHLGLTDLPLSARLPARERFYGALEGREAVATTNDFILAFLDHYLSGKDNGFPERQFAAHPAMLRHDASSVREWWINRPATARALDPAR